MSWFKRLADFMTLDVTPPAKVDDDLRMVNAPVLGFVRTVKENPRRFRCRREFPTKEEVTQYTWMTRENTKFFKIRDKLLGHTFIAVVHQGKLYSVHGAGINLNGWELKYLSDKLVPVFVAAVNRKHVRAQKMADKVRVGLQRLEQQRRDEWTGIYGE